MNVGEVARLFPADPKEWTALGSPARVFPYDLRARFRTRLASPFAAADRARPRAAARLGVSTRAYEPGDAFKDISLPLLARLGEYHTRVDNAPGRAQGLVVAHLYGNMAFAGASEEASKGQVALTVAGLLQTAHLGALHGFRLLPCFEEDLPTFLRSHENAVRRARWLWVVTDGLFDARSPDGGLAALATCLAARPALKTNLVIVRDALELPAWALSKTKGAPLTSARLSSFLDVSAADRIAAEAPAAKAGERRFSGEAYERALVSQLESLTLLAGQQGFGRALTRAGMTLETLARDLEMLA